MKQSDPLLDAVHTGLDSPRAGRPKGGRSWIASPPGIVALKWLVRVLDWVQAHSQGMG